ncbi:MAG: hypothetical protein J6Y78_15005 [Paludibacteraceae bacterium]|nr:hypothetical protein [Paludibacteraceae bacterium]
MRTNFTMQNQNITIVRGDSLSFNIVMYGDIQELDSVYFTVKKDWGNAEPTFIKSLSDGVSEVEEGIYAVRVAPEDTQDLNVGQYYYDLQVGSGADVFTVCRGIFEIVYDVTDADDVIPEEEEE